MQIGEAIEYLLMNMVLTKRTVEDTNPKRHIFMPLDLGMG
jgi:hypothetical protein